MRIGNQYIGGDKPCFIVAEAGLSHGGDPSKAFELVDAAVSGGADAVKFQVYRTRDLIDRNRDPELFTRFKSKELRFEVFGELKQYAKERGIVFFATPHTLSGLDYLRGIGIPIYKVGSGERGSKLFGKILEMGKPTFISTGMRTQSEVLRMVELYGGKKTAFLHCVTMYPVPPHFANLGFLRRLGVACGQVGSLMGYSCHMEGTLGVELAVAMGAKIIEKHLMLPGTVGQDVSCSLFAGDFRAMTKKIRMIESAVGEEGRVYSGAEKDNEKWACKSKDGKRPL